MKSKFSVRGSSRPSTMHRTICSECGNECEVPFKPNGKKPVFCHNCFKDQDGEKPTMHKTTCSSCGKTCEVPFRPSGQKPIYCNQCFGKSSTAPATGRGGAMKSSAVGSTGGAVSKDQFDILNTKLDKILKLLAD